MTVKPHPNDTRPFGADRVQRGWAEHARRSQHPSNSAVEDDVVDSIATGLAAVSPPWCLAANQSPTQVHVEKLLDTEAYDAWLVYLPPFSNELRAQDARTGVVAVVDGAVRLTTSPNHESRWRDVRAGDSTRVGGDAQSLANPFAAPSTTVHVYSPPLGTLLLDEVA